MKKTHSVMIEVAGQALLVQVTLEPLGDVPELEGYVTEQMVFQALSTNQPMTYLSRHHKDRTVAVTPIPVVETLPVAVKMPAPVVQLNESPRLRKVVCSPGGEMHYANAR